MNKVLALTKDGRLTYCTAPEDQRGKGSVIIFFIKKAINQQKILLEKLKILRI